MATKEWIEKHSKYTNDIMASENNTGYTNIGAKSQAMKSGRG